MILRRLRQLVGGLTLLLVLVITVAVLTPESVVTVPAVQDLLDAATTLDSEIVGLVGSITVGVLLIIALLISRTGTRGEDVFDALRRNPPETVNEAEAPRVGDTLDRAIAAPNAVDRVDLQTQLREIAEEQLRLYGPDNQDPVAAVADGSWTDRRPAAVFISENVQETRLERLRYWLDPDAERDRRIRATVAALEAITETDR